MSPQIAGSARREEGTASIELIGAVPFLLLAILVAAQLGAAGYALWSAGIAARAGARAASVEGDSTSAARRALPGSLKKDAAVTDEDGVAVRVVVPRLLPGMPQLTVSGRASLETGGG